MFFILRKKKFLEIEGDVTAIKEQLAQNDNMLKNLFKAFTSLEKQYLEQSKLLAEKVRGESEKLGEFISKECKQIKDEEQNREDNLRKEIEGRCNDLSEKLEQAKNELNMQNKQLRELVKEIETVAEANIKNIGEQCSEQAKLIIETLKAENQNLGELVSKEQKEYRDELQGKGRESEAKLNDVMQKCADNGLLLEQLNETMKVMLVSSVLNELPEVDD